MKTCCLRLGVLVEVVETDLADSDDLRGGDESLYLRVAGGVCKLRVMGMDARRCVNILVRGGEFSGAVERARTCPIADAQDGFYAGRARARENLGTV